MPSYASYVLADFVASKENQSSVIAHDIARHIPQRQQDELYALSLEEELVYEQQQQREASIYYSPPSTDSPQSPAPSPPLPPLPPSPPPPPPPSLMDSQALSQEDEEEWMLHTTPLDFLVNPIPVPYFPSIDWDIPSYTHALYDSTASHAAIENSLREFDLDVVAEPEPPTAAANAPPQPRESRAERRRRREAEKRRRAAEKEKARLCHNIFCRLPR